MNDLQHPDDRTGELDAGTLLGQRMAQTSQAPPRRLLTSSSSTPACKQSEDTHEQCTSSAAKEAGYALPASDVAAWLSQTQAVSHDKAASQRGRYLEEPLEDSPEEGQP